MEIYLTFNKFHIYIQFGKEKKNVQHRKFHITNGIHKKQKECETDETHKRKKCLKI